MAKSTKSRSVRKGSPGKKQAVAASRKAPAKAARKAAAKPSKGKAPKGAQAKGAKPARRQAPRKEVVESSAMPEHAASKAAARRAVARPTKAHHEAQAAKVDHDHQDPRLAGLPGTSPEDSKVQTFNYGQFKNKAVARMDKPVNWFRRAPRPKQ
jgi:hypothetical protein